MAERFRKLPGMDPIMDSALSFAASKEDPASGGRHKVWGSKPLWVLPQTSTIASHLPKALGTAVAIEAGKRLGARPADPGRLHRHLLLRRRLRQPRHRADRVQRGQLDGLPEAAGAGAVRLRGQRHRHLGEDADGLDRRELPQPPRPRLLLRRRPRPRQRLRRRAARGGALPPHPPADLPAPAHHSASWATPAPTSRSSGAASRSCARWRRAIRCCARPRSRWSPGLMTKDEMLALYEDTRRKCFAAAEDADSRPRIDDAGGRDARRWRRTRRTRCRPRPPARRR